MLYPARWKKITVDQSKVLKNRLYWLFRFYWATRYSCCGCVTGEILIFSAFHERSLTRFIFHHHHLSAEEAGAKVHSSFGICICINHWRFVSWEPEGHYHYSVMFHWEPEGCYPCIIQSLCWKCPPGPPGPPDVLSVESQKGTITIQWCSIETQKAAIPVQSLCWKCPPCHPDVLSVESQKGIITIQWRSVETQKAAIPVYTKPMLKAPSWFSTEHCWTTFCALLVLGRVNDS